MGNDLENINNTASTPVQSTSSSSHVDSLHSTEPTRPKLQLWMTHRQKVMASVSIAVLSSIVIACPLLLPTVGATAIIIASSIIVSAGILLLISSFPHTEKERNYHAIIENTLNNILSRTEKQEFLPVQDPKVIKEIREHSENFEIIDKTAEANASQISWKKEHQLKTLEEKFEAGEIKSLDDIQLSDVNLIQIFKDLPRNLTSSFGYYDKNELKRKEVSPTNDEKAFANIISFIKEAYPDSGEEKRIKAFLSFLNLPNLQGQTTAPLFFLTEQKIEEGEDPSIAQNNYMAPRGLFALKEKPSIIFNEDGSVSFYSALATKVGKKLMKISSTTETLSKWDEYSEDFLPAFFLTEAKGTYIPHENTSKSGEWITTRVIYPTEKYRNELFKNSKH